MQNKKAFHLLNTWAKPYLYADEDNMKLIFDENAPIGTGKTNEIFVQMTKQPTCSPQKTGYSDRNMP